MATRTLKDVAWPALLDDPEMRAAQEKINELKAELGRVEAELDRRYGDWRAGHVPTLQDAAAAVLAGADPDDDPEASYHEETRRLERRRRVLREAVDLAVRRRNLTRGAASRRLLAPLVPAYREHLQRAADLAGKLLALAAEERELAEHLAREWIMPDALRLIPLGGVAARIEGWLAAVREHHGITPRT